MKSIEEAFAAWQQGRQTSQYEPGHIVMETAWYRWFAWHPVRTSDGCWRWLSFVERRDSSDAHGAWTDYRLSLTQIEKLQQLATQWANRARMKFRHAEAETDPVARRFIEHGATCYANAALELRALIANLK